MFLEFMVFALLAAGIFLQLGRIWRGSLRTADRPPNVYEITTGEAGSFLTRRIRKQFREMQRLLESSGNGGRYAAYCRVSAVLSIAGGCIALLLGNVFLLPVAVLLGMFVPFLLARISASAFRKQQNAEELTTLSIITSSYKRTKNILMSVEENIQYLHEPFRTVFQNFLSENEFLTSNIERSLQGMKGKITSRTWGEWCDTMIICQHDHTKMDMLESVNQKLRRMSIVQTEVDTLLYAPIKDFAVMVVMVLINFPLIFFMNRSWFNTLLFSLPGKIAIAFTVAVLLFSLILVIRATSPMEYTR